MNYRNRLARVIPGGAHTYSRGTDQFPANAPDILAQGSGAIVTDPEGKSFLDYGMALRAITLGYAHREVNDAAISQINKGNNLTKPSFAELEAAELFTSIIPGADMVKFAKNGSNVTTGAIKLARAYTGRKYVCIPDSQPFFSFDDWFIGTTPVTKGVLEDAAKATLKFKYGDYSSLQNIFDYYPGQIAAVLLEPATTFIPCDPESCQSLAYDKMCLECPNNQSNFLHRVKQLCQLNGAILIFDEMITGFRYSLEGAGSFYGVLPDLMTFGKAMGNGFSVAALGGSRDIMELASINNIGNERTFLMSTTHGGEMASLGAFVKVVEIYSRDSVCELLWDFGKRLRVGMKKIIREHRLTDYVRVSGPDISLSIDCLDPQGFVSLDHKTLLMQELVKERVLMPWLSWSIAHDSGHLEWTLNAFDVALSVYRQALDSDVSNYLEGPSVKPVFRQFN